MMNEKLVALRRRVPSRNRLINILSGLGMKEPRRGIPFELHFQCVKKLVDTLEKKFGKNAIQKACNVFFRSDNKLVFVLMSHNIGEMRDLYREVYTCAPGSVSRLPIILDYLINNITSLEELSAFLSRLDGPIPRSMTVGGQRINQIAEHIVKDSLPELFDAIELEMKNKQTEKMNRERERVKVKAKQMGEKATKRRLIADVASLPLMENLFDLIPEPHIRKISPDIIDDEAKRIVRKKSFYKALLNLSQRFRNINGRDKAFTAILVRHSHLNSQFFINVNLKDYWNGRISGDQLNDAIEQHGKLIELDGDAAQFICQGIKRKIKREHILGIIKGSHIGLTVLRIKIALKLRAEYHKTIREVSR
jgi:hypothetical protein